MSDLINRQDAIRLAEQGQIQGFEWQFKKLCTLPSAEPEPILDKIRSEIGELYINLTYEENSRRGASWGLRRALEIIDKYKSKSDIEELPSAEPERKKGKWLYGEESGQDGWHCSECGFFVPWYYGYYGLDNIDFIVDYHTCPKCDAKMLKYTGMRGEQDEID